MLSKSIFEYFLILFLMLSLCSCEGDKPTRNQGSDIHPSNDKYLNDKRPSPEVEVAGIFRTRKGNCLTNFGLCEVEFLPRTDYNENIDTLMKKGEDKKNAMFKHNLNKEDEMRIEFTEEIPQFSDTFTVDQNLTYKNLFGYEYIKPVIGSYPTDKNINRFGGVAIKIQRGNRIKQ